MQQLSSSSNQYNKSTRRSFQGAQPSHQEDSNTFGSRRSQEKSCLPKLKVFVGGIPQDTNRQELAAYFSKFGEVAKVDLPKNKKRKSYKGIAFITFRDPRSAEHAVRSPDHRLRGKKMIVTEALAASEASRRTKELQGRKLFVKGLSPSIRETDLVALFGRFGVVESVIIPRSKNPDQNKGIAYVVMGSRESTDKLVQLGVVPLGDLWLEVSKATSPKSMKELKNTQNKFQSQPPFQIQPQQPLQPRARRSIHAPVPVRMQHDFDKSIGRLHTPNADQIPHAGFRPQLDISLGESSHSSSVSSSEEDSFFEDDENYVFNLGIQPGEAIIHPKRFEVGDEYLNQDFKYVADLSGEKLYTYHNLIFRRFPQASPEPGEVRVRNNNGHTVKTCNHESSDYICRLEGGIFDEEEHSEEEERPSPPQAPSIVREHHFGPANHFGNIRRQAGNDSLAINEEGVTRFGPNFTRPIQDFFYDYNHDEIPTVEIKQSVTTRYTINNEGLIFTGEVNEVNVWGTHPHEDQLEMSVDGQDEED